MLLSINANSGLYICTPRALLLSSLIHILIIQLLISSPLLPLTLIYHSITISFSFIMTNTMKSFMIQQADDEPEDMANTLMLLSKSTDSCNARMFECKTCNRHFPSFQALGGHRASHRKPRQDRNEEAQIPAEPTKPHVHECSICGVEFSLGQALGGHMRRHRAKGEGANVKQERKWAGSGLNLDLNLAPPEVDVEFQEGIDLELHLDLKEKVRFVQWLH